jgi:hypothetical protein
MRVRVWNAYASNNSGSYTIVGLLPSTEIAERTAAELRAMIEAHTAWLEQAEGKEVREGKGALMGSPLAAFCREHELEWGVGQPDWDEWPHVADDNNPDVFVVERQIFVHHGYCTGLPAAFGELFYKRGGRVQHEEVGPQYPLVVTATFSWGRTDEGHAKAEVELPLLLAAIIAPDAEVRGSIDRMWPPAWRATTNRFANARLTYAAVFWDLVGGVAHLRDLAEAHGASLEVRLAQASGDGDPLASLRPSVPAVARFDLHLISLRRAVRFGAVVERLLGHRAASLLLERLPVILAQGLYEDEVRDIAEEIAATGAEVTVEPCEY